MPVDIGTGADRLLNGLVRPFSGKMEAQLDTMWSRLLLDDARESAPRLVIQAQISTEIAPSARRGIGRGGAGIAAVVRVVSVSVSFTV